MTKTQTKKRKEKVNLAGTESKTKMGCKVKSGQWRQTALFYACCK